MILVYRRGGRERRGRARGDKDEKGVRIENLWSKLLSYAFLPGGDLKPQGECEPPRKSGSWCVVDTLSPSPVSMAEQKCWHCIMVFKRQFWTSHKTVLHPFNLHLDAAKISYGSISKLSLQFQSKFLFPCDVYYSSYTIPWHSEKIFRNSVFTLPSLPEGWLGKENSSFWKKNIYIYENFIHIYIYYSLVSKKDFGWTTLGVQKMVQATKWCPFPFLFLQNRNKKTAPF